MSYHQQQQQQQLTTAATGQQQQQQPMMNSFNNSNNNPLLTPDGSRANYRPAGGVVNPAPPTRGQFNSPHCAPVVGAGPGQDAAPGSMFTEVPLDGLPSSRVTHGEAPSQWSAGSTPTSQNLYNGLKPSGGGPPVPVPIAVPTVQYPPPVPSVSSFETVAPQHVQRPSPVYPSADTNLGGHLTGHSSNNRPSPQQHPATGDGFPGSPRGQTRPPVPHPGPPPSVPTTQTRPVNSTQDKQSMNGHTARRQMWAGNGPPSQRSSATPSPVPTQKYDALEAQGTAPTSTDNSPQLPRSTTPQYPTNTPQYPTNTPQFPSNTPQYPSNTPQYPTNTPQYPTNTPQYPTNTPQYPSNTPQYPSTRPQYPTSNPQYPTGQAQYPSNTPLPSTGNPQSPLMTVYQTPTLSELANPSATPQSNTPAPGPGSLTPGDNSSYAPGSGQQEQPRTGITGRRQYPGQPQQPTHQNQTGIAPSQQPTRGQPAPGLGTVQANSYNALTTGLGQLNVHHGDTRPINLLQNRHILPTVPIEPTKANLSHDYKKINCDPSVFRSTLTSLPQNQSILTKSKLPLGIIIHPFKDLTNLPVIQSTVIVRCRGCRTYINPFVTFVDARRWKCNLCYRQNDVPEEFLIDPVSKTYGEPQRRPEIRSSTVEFIAPSEYMLRPPQPAVYLYLFDVSFNAIESGYLTIVCQSILENIDRIPGDARTKIGFISYDSTIHFYNLQEGLAQPQMLIVSDLDDVFLPSPDNLLVNLSENRDLVIDLLNQLPEMFNGNRETHSAMGPALMAAHKLLSATGGRVSVFQTALPSIGPGRLEDRTSRDNKRDGDAKDAKNLTPSTDFYKKWALDFSSQQIAVDLFVMSSNYTDFASISGISKYSGGSLFYYPSFHHMVNPAQAEKLENDLQRYLTRKIGFEAVMRIRCTKGMSIHTFHGNFFVRSTDLLSLPNINPDAGFGMQIAIDDSLNEGTMASFQAALLYTNTKGERRIRVHTLCLPVTSQLTEVYAGADCHAVVALLSCMAVDRSRSSSVQDAREAFINMVVDCMSAFKQTLPSSATLGNVMAPFTLRLLPMYILALLKCDAFRLANPVSLDRRAYAMEKFKCLPIVNNMLTIYPRLYPIHSLSNEGALHKEDGSTIPQPPVLPLSSESLSANGAYLFDVDYVFYVFVCRQVSDEFCINVLDVPNYASIQEPQADLPELENSMSQQVWAFMRYLLQQRPFHAPVIVIRETSKHRGEVLKLMVDDRSEDSVSYVEFLQHVQSQMPK